MLRVGGYAGGSINDTTLALSVQNLIGHLSKVTSIDNTYKINDIEKVKKLRYTIVRILVGGYFREQLKRRNRKETYLCNYFPS